MVLVYSGGPAGFDPEFILEKSGGKAFKGGENIPFPWVMEPQPSLIAY